MIKLVTLFTPGITICFRWYGDGEMQKFAQPHHNKWDRDTPKKKILL